MAVRVCRVAATGGPREIVAIVPMLALWHLSVLGLLWAGGRVGHGVAKLGLIAWAEATVLVMAAAPLRLPDHLARGWRTMTGILRSTRAW